MFFAKNIVNYKKKDIGGSVFCQTNDGASIFFCNEISNRWRKAGEKGGLTLGYGARQLDLIGKNRSHVWAENAPYVGFAYRK